MDQKIVDYWQAFVNTLPEEERPQDRYQAWHFTNRPEPAIALANLVREGTKQATASLLWSFEAENEAIPATGDYSVIIDFDNNPLCIIQSTRIEIHPFNEVDAAMAYDEGEGDRSLDYWRKVHWEFFGEECASIGRKPTQDMPVVCERFKCVYRG